MSKLLNYRFPEGRHFLHYDNTKLKKSSKLFFSVSELFNIDRRYWVKIDVFKICKGLLIAVRA